MAELVDYVYKQMVDCDHRQLFAWLLVPIYLMK